VGPHNLRDGTVLDDLDELQVVTRREFRRGYDGLFNGRPMRLAYAKIMDVPGGLLVYRPALGQERPKRVPRVTGKDLLLFAVCAWPVTLVVLLFLVSLINLGLRAL
jgi:hypothetical protein